ncbi:MAG: NADH-quinone oxidoreductase subunit NuoF [Thermoplasmata archaeon]|nr:MAG: NADH-quinone oxidoreductase subunit NuoF [Thermoplasmata archaeon]
MNKILVCVGTSGVSAGAEKVADNFERLIRKSKLDFRVIRVGDRGLFRDVLVDIIIDDERVTYEFVTPEDVENIIQSHIIEKEPVKKLLAGDDYKDFFKTQQRIVLANCGEIDPEDINEYIKTDGYKALEKALSMKSKQIIEEMKSSGLRGRGGAGFSTGLKWQFAHDAKGDEKYIICNADEGDPGAFMDRSILEGDPHALIEGMVIGAYAIGATHGYIYCRAEYPLAIKRLNIAMDQARKKKFLGKKILGSNFDFDVVIKEGAGAFVCGEETALMASIEGKRGMPNPRPPFPAQKGLWGKPSNINNVETFANVRHIILNGADWFSSIGYKKSKGTKVFALAGKIKNTGLVEVPMGTKIRDILEGNGGGVLDKKIPIKAVQLGGPSGGCVPEELFDTPIDYESISETGAIMGSGGMVVMDQKTCMVDVARYFLSFTVAESCGKCVPCRIGLKRMYEVLEIITEGNGTQEHLDFLKEMSDTILKTALCNLGNTAPNPVLTTMKYYFDEYESHIKDHKCPAAVCTNLIKFEIIKDKCIKCGRCFKACPVDAIDWKKKEYPVLHKNKCIKCKSCINACPVMAIE